VSSRGRRINYGDVSQVADAVTAPWANGTAANGRGRRVRKRRVKLDPELERYRLFTVAELGELPKIEFLPGTPLAARELTGLYGKGDMLKTFTALGWACSLAARGLPVVYIAAEGGTGLNARIRAWMLAHRVASVPALRVMPANVSVHDPEAVADWLKAMAEQLGSERPVLVVIDTLARNFVGGSENDPKEMGRFVDGCEAMRRHLGCAVLVIHHTTKDGDTERGTESLRNASFAMFKADSKRGLLLKLKCDRMKDLAQPVASDLEFRRVEFPEPVSGLTSSLALMTETEVMGNVPFRNAVVALMRSRGGEGEGEGRRGWTSNAILKGLSERGQGINRQEGLRLLAHYAAEAGSGIVAVGRRYALEGDSADDELDARQ
jgi:hypothetical protein